MAKQRRTNSGTSALGSLLDTINIVAAVELKDKPEELAKVNKMTADMKDSHIITAFELQDDAIEAYHEAAQDEQGEIVGGPPEENDEEDNE